MTERIKTFIDAWKSLFTGLRLSIKRTRMKEVTVLYPFEKPQIADRFRGAPMVLRYLGETDEKEGSCIACGLCVKACPVNCIAVEREKDKEAKLKVADWQIDLTKCLFCGLCTEACPTNALVMSHDYENAEYTKDKLVYGMERALRRPISIQPAMEER